MARRAPAPFALYLGLVALAVAVRLAYLPEVAAQPDFDAPAVDAAYHDYWAHGIATGEWGKPGGQIISEDPEIEAHPFFRPPGYPYALALIYATAGDEPHTVRVVQMLLGGLSCGLVALLGARVFRPAVGLIAGGLTMCTWTLVYFEGELQAPAILISLQLLALLALVRSEHSPRLLWPALAGGLLGLCALFVPNVLALLPLAAFWVGRATAQRARRLGHAALLVAAALATLAPAPIRNLRVSGEFVPISTNLGINLYAGNNPGANGHDVGLDAFGTSFEHRAMVRHAQREAGEALTDAEVSGYWSGLAVDHIRANPGQTLALVGRKAVMFWAAREIASNKELNFAREESTVLRLLPVGFSHLAGLGVVGWFIAMRRSGAPSRRNASVAHLLGLWIVVFFATYLPFFVTARYRVPLVPLLAIFSAVTVLTIVELARTREWTRLAGYTVAVMAIFGALQVDLATRAPNAADWHHLQGVTLARTDRLPAAVERLGRAIEADPAAFESLHERGKVHLRKGEPALAIADFRAALEVAPQASGIALDLGQVLRRTGRPAQAAAVYRRALEHSPGHAPLHSNLGLALQSNGELPEAAAAFEDALAIDADFFPAVVNLGIVRAELGELERALAHFEHAVALDPDSEAARQNRDRAREMLGL